MVMIDDSWEDQRLDPEDYRAAVKKMIEKENREFEKEERKLQGNKDLFNRPFTI